jgi:hypothetical protein
MKTLSLIRSISILSICLLIFGLHGLSLAGTTGKIAGRVSDSETGEPLPGANIQLEGTTMGSATDLDGDFFVINIQPGTYTVTATMVGYQSVNITDVRITADRTTMVNFDLKSTILEGDVITVVADREVVKMDVSSSQITAEGQQMVQVPLVIALGDFLDLQAGIINNQIRGGGLDQVGFIVDGLDANDNRSNKPGMTVNMSSISELTVIKGGFNAEYGNIRSGLINVVTKEGSPSRYGGYVDFRIAPAVQRHKGPAVTSPNNYWNRPYLDPDVMWQGTQNWSQEMQRQNRTFIGWNAISEQFMSDDDPTNDKTPQECRDMWLWEQAIEGASAVGQNEQTYADKPTWNLDLSLGGPVPGGKVLGNLSFFASYRYFTEQFPLPDLIRDTFDEQNIQLKLTSRLSPAMKLQVEGMYSEIKTMDRASDGESTVDDDWFRSGEEAIGFMGGGRTAQSHRGFFDVYRSMLGVTFDHILSPATFYNVRLSRVYLKNYRAPFSDPRDTTTVRYFGNTPVDERPWGNSGGTSNLSLLVDDRLHSTVGYGFEDYSEVTTYSMRFDLTSQINKHNQIKTGLQFVYDDLSTKMWLNLGRQYATANSRNSDHDPFRIHAYIQDKLEFEGLIANLGLRLDYSNPNSEWYDLDPYSVYFKKEYRDVFTEVAPKAPSQETKLRLSPRLGIAHPIGEAAKIYFNYGHFYSMPLSADMYRLETYEKAQGITHLGNPYIEPPKTVAYELGFDFNISNMFLFTLTGYYKDVTGQAGRVGYVNYDGTVDYTTIETNNYQDIRGVEIQLEKRFGAWVTGFINYTYEVGTSGFTGREQYYQDPRQQLLFGLHNPQLERPLARPYARANISFRSPIEYGDLWGDWELSWLARWRTGSYFTWDPLNTNELENNLQQQDQWGVDLRISKRFSISGVNVTVFADIVNVFDLQYLNWGSFGGGDDYESYLKSLHLPMYEGAEYQAIGLTPGDDVPGELATEKKPYIDSPNIDHMWFLNPRYVWLGFNVDF